MGAPLFIGATSSASTASFSLAWPDGERTNDLGVLVIEGSGTDTTPTITGWTHISGSPFVDVASAAGSKVSVLTKIATSNAEANVTIPDGGDHQLATMLLYRNVDTTTPINVVASTLVTTASTARTFPSATTTVNDCTTLLLCSRPLDSTSTTFWTVAPNGGNGTAPVLVGNYTSASGNGGGFSIYESILATAGATGTPTGTFANSTTSVVLSIAIASNGTEGPSAVTTNAAEVLYDGDAQGRITTFAAEALYDGDAYGRITTFAIEVLMSIDTIPNRRRQLRVNGVKI